MEVRRHHHRLAYTGIVSAVVLAIGLFALRFPVFLDDYDQWGWQINCGTGYVSELTQATAATGPANYVDECESALMLRRLWTIPLAVVGAIVLLTVVVASAITSGSESLVRKPDTA
ncbi:hypothetical protein [Mycobacterium sp. MMS18-G62]